MCCLSLRNSNTGCLFWYIPLGYDSWLGIVLCVCMHDCDMHGGLGEVGLVYGNKILLYVNEKNLEFTVKSKD